MSNRDEILMPLVVEYLGRPEVAASGYLLDGFPRSADQAEVLLDAKLQSLLVNPAPPPICTAANLHRRLIWLAGKARVLMMVCGCQVLRLEVPDELIIERCEGRRYLPRPLPPYSYPFRSACAANRVALRAQDGPGDG